MQKEQSHTRKEFQACNFMKKKLQHRCFTMNIAKFLRTAILKNTSGGCFWSWNKTSSFRKKFLQINGQRSRNKEFKVIFVWVNGNWLDIFLWILKYRKRKREKEVSRIWTQLMLQNTFQQNQANHKLTVVILRSVSLINSAHRIRK